MTDIAERPMTRTLPQLITEIPGPRAREHISFDETWTSPSLPRAYGLVPVRGEGCAVEDIDGNWFLDFTAGIAVSATGYGHPQVTAAIKDQVDRLLHYSASDFYLPIYAETAARLASIAPIRGRARTFLTNSGTEAVESAMKLARFATGRPYLIAFLGAFHGRTYGAVSLTASKAKYHEGFAPLLPGVHHVPFGSAGLDELEHRLFKRIVSPDEVAAIFVEPIQGEGGYVIPDRAFLPRLREICDRHGILLVADEIQSGAGRTGRMWAIEHWDVQPDIVCVAKGIASGLPLGAMIARADLMTWKLGHHGSTFGGNPVSCAAALATIGLLEDGLIANAAVRGDQALAALRPLVRRHGSIVRDVRGKGLMVGVQFDSGETAEAVQDAAFQRGLLVLEAGDDVVRMSPPLTVSEAQIVAGVGLFGEAVAEVATHRGRVLRHAARTGALNEVQSAI